MKLAVIGSRGLSMDISPYIPDDCTEIISGGAVGIDTAAEYYADCHRISKHIIRPQYDKYGNKAPLIRNKLIVDIADEVLAIWDGRSRGTKYTIDYANQCQKPVTIITP